MKNLIKDKRGIILPIAVGIPLILGTFLLWVVSMYPTAIFWSAINPMMPTKAHGIMMLLNNVAGWVLLIEVIGVLAWMAVWAYQREIVDVPA
jgi:hypothetical protein